MIWIDNDGAPRVARELTLKAAQRRSLRVSIVGNTPAQMAREFVGSPLFSVVTVDKGFDAADDHIANHCQPGDLVITEDVPLAARVIAKGARGLSPRGREFDAASIGDQLATRNLMHEFRSGAGVTSLGGGAPPFGDQDKKRFADALDRALAKMKPQP